MDRLLASKIFRNIGRSRYLLNYSNNRACWTSVDFQSTKGTYSSNDPDIPFWQAVNGFRDIREHTKMYLREVRDKFHDRSRRVLAPEHEDVIVEFSFKNPDMLKKFQVTSDGQHRMGHSRAELELTKSGTALFHGNLCTNVPKDGKNERSGFAAIRSFRKYKAFFRADYFTLWQNFTHLILKVRGDGRIYLVTLGCPGEFDIEMADVFCYPLYTHGGPYWQYVKIPFSKFIMTVNGRIPEKAQRPLVKYKGMIAANHMISSVGISLMDRIDGPFQLEIDWIGVYNDATNFEEWAYESYKTPVLTH